MTLFTITTADLREEHFRAGGKGGQKQNKTDSGARFTHEPSGAVGECREERSWTANRKRAFQRMAEHPKFQAWARMQAAAKLEGFASTERKVEASLVETNLIVEVGVPAKPGDVTE